jgi:hypothetical protein
MEVPRFLPIDKNRQEVFRKPLRSEEGSKSPFHHPCRSNSLIPAKTTDMKTIIGRKGRRDSSSSASAEDTQRVSQLLDEQEQVRIDEVSSNPALDRPFATKSKGKTKRLLNLLDSLSQGGIH